MQAHGETCAFCDIVLQRAPASIVYSDPLTLAFVDLRQFHPGHMLVIPRQHLADVRELDGATGAALMSAVSLIAAAVAKAFPNDGLSVWHSIGAGAFQEVPHLHFHIHPRLIGDGFMRIYPGALPGSDAALRECYAAQLREQLLITAAARHPQRDHPLENP